VGVILVLEDEPGLLRLLSRALNGAGYQVLTATSADEAVQVSDGHDVTVLVADVNSPGASGPVVAQFLRERHANMKVLYISGHDRSFLSSHGISPDADFLQKPFSPSRLVGEVTRLLGGSTPSSA
jgi:DNA-binding response OmpR family regulator